MPENWHMHDYASMTHAIHAQHALEKRTAKEITRPISFLVGHRRILRLYKTAISDVGKFGQLLFKACIVVLHAGSRQWDHAGRHYYGKFLAQGDLRARIHSKRTAEIGH